MLRILWGYAHAGFTEVFEFEEGKKLKQKWGIPESYVGIGHCIIGYTDDAIKQAADRKSDYVVYSE